MPDENETERRVKLARDLGAMQTDIKNIKDDLPEIKATTGKIFATLEGKNGLVSKVAVLETQQKDIPTLRKVMIIASIWSGLTSAVVIISYFGIKTFV